MLVGLALVAGGVVAAPQGTAAQAQSDPCTSSPAPSMDFLLPAWADQSGWANPQQYSTIQGADVDGDGTGDLLGRNAAFLEVFTWAAPTAAMGPGAPKQWVAQSAPGNGGSPQGVKGPALPEADSFFDPSVSTTLQTADLDGDGADEVFYRSVDGIEVFDYANGAWAGPSTGGPWGDANSLNDPVWDEIYYGTIQAGDVDGDGDDDLVGRTSEGIETWARQSDGSFLRLETGASQQVFTNAQGWTDRHYTDTIQLGELDDTPGLELLARASNGLHLYDFTVTDATTGQGTWTTLAASGPWTDAEGWKHFRYTETITTGDLDGDGLDEVVGRSQYGLDAYGWDTTDGWVPAVTTPTSSDPGLLTDAQGYGASKYYGTIQTAQLRPAPASGAPVAEQVLARGPQGLGVYRLDTGSTSFVEVGSTISQMSDANGWDQPVRYGSITAVDLGAGRGQAVVGKDATGVRTYVLPVLGGPWVSPTETFPVWTVTRAPGWPSTYEDRAYDYINDHAVTGGDPATVLGEMQDLDIDTGQLVSNIENLDYPKGKNITHQAWQDVETSTLAWAEAAENVRGFLGVGSGSGSGVYQIMLDSFVTGGSGASIDSIADKFEVSDDAEVLALVGDLIWGALGAIPGSAFITDEVGALVFNGSMSIAGSGVSAGVGFANPNGSVTTKAKELQEKTIEQFCSGVAFLNVAYGQIAGDLGLLTAMQQMVASGVLSMTGDQYTDALAQANAARQVWAYQQFASMGDYGWRTAYGDNYASPNAVQIGDYFYQVLHADFAGNPDCLDHDLVSGWSDLTTDLGVDPVQDVFQPTVSAARSSNLGTSTAPVGTFGEPYDKAIGASDAQSGILGWRIAYNKCGP